MVVIPPVRFSQAGCRDGVLQVGIDVGEALLEPPDVLTDVALDRPTRKAEAILLGGEHLDDLATACQETLEAHRGVVRQWPWLVRTRCAKSARMRASSASVFANCPMALAKSRT